MLIRDTNGNIVNIKRSDFISDGEYYKQLSQFYGISLSNINNINTTINYNVTIKTSKDKILETIRMM